MKTKLFLVILSSAWLCLTFTAAASTNSVESGSVNSPDSATSAGKLEIQRAIYGAVGFGTVDVEANLMAAIQRGQNSIVANNDLIGYDPASEHGKQLRIEYIFDGKPGALTVDEGKTFTYSASASPPFQVNLPVMKSPDTIRADESDTFPNPGTLAAKLKILQAIYGAVGVSTVDVKTNLMVMIQSGQNPIVANNDLVGYDPASGQEKQLRIEYIFDGKPGAFTVDEGKSFTFSASASPPFHINLPVMKSPDIIRAGAVGNAFDLAASAPKLKIQQAIYGAVGFGIVEVKTNLMALLQSGQNSIVANNDLVGYDPASGHGKQLRIDYIFDGKPGTITVDEGKTFLFSPSANPPFQVSLPVMKLPDVIKAGKGDTSFTPAVPAAKLEIQQAVYGGDGVNVQDVKAKLTDLIQSGQNSLVVDNDLAGHDPASGQVKQLRVDYTLDGKPGTVTVDEGKTLTYSASANPPFGIKSARNPLNTIVAENYDAVGGAISTEVCSEGGYALCSIHDGNYAIYKNYDFDSGVTAFKARIASANHVLIEVRLDGPSGPLIGQCSSDGTGGWQNWRDVTCNVDHSQAGVRNVCLVFHGDTQSALVNVSSFAFQKSGEVNTAQISFGPTRVDAAVPGREK